MNTSLVLTFGVLALVWIALLIGASMDTESQRREWRRIARERRLRREEYLRDQEHRAATARRPLGPDGLCADCPLRE
ncbi:hypothetical protein [Pseudonocardia phyllosphaerae]|uniref:hypothetical protein n=1 Tax=Pseudonocardia phyllosphaerae TaxID=3390502 RepID=UPI00397AB737